MAHERAIVLQLQLCGAQVVEAKDRNLLRVSLGSVRRAYCSALHACPRNYAPEYLTLPGGNTACTASGEELAPQGRFQDFRELPGLLFVRMQLQGQHQWQWRGFKAMVFTGLNDVTERDL